MFPLVSHPDTKLCRARSNISTWIPVSFLLRQQDKSSWHVARLPWLFPSLRRLFFFFLHLHLVNKNLPDISLWICQTGQSWPFFFPPNFIYVLLLSLMILRFVLKSPLGLESGYYLWIKEQAVGHTHIFPKHKEHCKNITFKGVCTKSQMSNAYIFVFLLILWLISKSIFLLTMLYWALSVSWISCPALFLGGWTNS